MSDAQLTSYQQRLVASRMKLMARFKNKMDASPSQADPRPLGSGPINQHGMPELPVGQVYTKKWPVLDLGIHPEISRDQWSLKIDGAVEQECHFTWKDLMQLEQCEDLSDFHCVTTWSKVKMKWKGVKVSHLLALSNPIEEACVVMCYGSDGYTTNVALEELLKEDVLLVYEYEGQPLTREHGGPARIITPQLYAWKGAKWICRLEVLTEDQPGFWEQRGYSTTAYPWRNDRYS